MARYKNGWVMVDCFLFHHTKPKKKAKNKTTVAKPQLKDTNYKYSQVYIQYGIAQ
ncbi:hypothetical protein VQW28_005096 [Escherichia coli]|nr:hypothetical protein [Escherichia coli]